jgi:hypothetical protein
LGTTLQFAAEVEARAVVEGIVMEINAGDPRLWTSTLKRSAPFNSASNDTSAWNVSDRDLAGTMFGFLI